MWATTAWDQREWSGDQSRGWTVIGRLREHQSLLRKDAENARRRVAKREATPGGSLGYMVAGDFEDLSKARWHGGPIVLAFLFAPPDSDAIRMLDARGGYFDVRTGNTWDLFFPGYYRSSRDSTVERDDEAALPVGENYTGDWYFSPRGFNDLRIRIEQSSNNLWQYSGGTDLVLINAWIAEHGEPEIDWVSTISGQVTDQSAGTQTLTLANIIERISRDLETEAEDRAYGVGEVTDKRPASAGHVGRDFTIQALSGIAAALGAKALGA